MHTIKFESGLSFKVNATRASGKPIEDRDRPPPKPYPNARQRASKAPVTLAPIKLGKS